MDDQIPWGKSMVVIVEGENEELMRFLKWKLESIGKRFHPEIQKPGNNGTIHLKFEIPENPDSSQKDKLRGLLQNQKFIIQTKKPNHEQP